MRIKLNALDEIKRPTLLHKHVAKINDIFIRKQIHAAKGDLETTPYWLQMQNEGFREEAGFFISHKTQDGARRKQVGRGVVNTTGCGFNIFIKEDRIDALPWAFIPRT
ncbi:hypothetical protein GCK72_003554 [Caenorhabditis remanei]|uniref:Uncharacterized protein n=1 Tax=Caenorhabditis remanei TaxID=31234 RepID=A0A6A5HYD9_CAERE|nr:hypothetical protein GCK72_003554 [Caenorhabditis remanei]KAF1771727.1 hypothetical protein GCK72_003554 [Caenorhabditis remanei]